MSYIGQQLPADVFSGFTTDSFTGDGSATTFTLSKAPFSEDGLIVVINNVIQQPTTNFTVSGTTLTIVGTAVANGDPLYAIHTSGAVPSTLASKVDVNGLSDGVILDADADTTISADTDDQIDFKAGGTDTMHIINGKVGIGTSSPSTNLHIFSTADNAPHLLLENFQNADTDDAPVIELYLNDETTGGIGDDTDVGVIRFTGDEKDSGTKETYAEIRGVAHDPGSGSGNRGNLSFFVQSGGSLNETMTIDEDKVGIGTTSPSPFKFHVDSDSSNNGVAKFNHSDSTPEGIRIIYSAAAPDNTTTNFLECTDSSATRLQILGDGDIKNHDGTYGTISDERIKQNIVDANSQWDDIKNVRVRNYKKKDDVRQYGEDNAPVHIGLIAQELQSVSPGLVDENRPSFADVQSNSEFGTLYEDGDDIPDGKAVGDVKEEKEKVLGIKYSILYMKAIKALQEAMAKIETLETKVKALEDA